MSSVLGMSSVIAIDGPAAVGKGTLAKAMAQHLNFAYLDTGKLYRAVGVRAAAQGQLAEATSIAHGLTVDDLAHPALRTPAAARYASEVAVQPGVRQALLAFQRDFGRTPPGGKAGAVLDGRDIGTVIFPDADLKLFITASAEVRARRRYKELPPETRPAFDDLLRQVQDRDARDAHRDTAPMVAAADAHLIDTSDLDTQAVLNLALSIWTQSR